MSKRLAFLDLDGVVCDDRHRVHHALNREWYEYFSLVHLDQVWSPGRELYENCILTGFEVAYLTGRREDIRHPTKTWLKKNNFDHKLPLHMRRMEDRRPLGEVKAERVAQALAEGYDEVWMFDDDPRVIELVGAVPGARARHCTWYIKPDRMIKRATT